MPGREISQVQRSKWSCILLHICSFDPFYLKLERRKR